MAAVAYANIRDQIKSILEGDALTSDSRVYLEEEPQFGLADAQTGIAVFLQRRTAPAEQQTLSAGKRTRFFIELLFVVFALNVESFKAAADIRDGVLGNLELVLMKDRTLGGTVTDLWLEGGEFYSAHGPAPGAFIAVAEVTVTASVSAVNS